MKPSEMIRTMRKDAGHTQDALAELVDVTRSTVQRWESRRIDIPTSMLWQVARVCGRQIELGGAVDDE